MDAKLFEDVEPCVRDLPEKDHVLYSVKEECQGRQIRDSR